MATGGQHSQGRPPLPGTVEWGGGVGVRRSVPGRRRPSDPELPVRDAKPAEFSEAPTAPGKMTRRKVARDPEDLGEYGVFRPSPVAVASQLGQPHIYHSR